MIQGFAGLHKQAPSVAGPARASSLRHVAGSWDGLAATDWFCRPRDDGRVPYLGTLLQGHLNSEYFNGFWTVNLRHGVLGSMRTRPHAWKKGIAITPGAAIAGELVDTRSEPPHVSSVPIDSATFRDAMSSVAAPVTVVTTMDGATPYGTTVSSFWALAMTPPLVMFALDGRSRLLTALQRNPRLAINILGHGQEGLATTFAQPRADRFCDSGWYTSAGLPRLPGIAAWFECRGEQVITAGGHEIRA